MDHSRNVKFIKAVPCYSGLLVKFEYRAEMHLSQKTERPLAFLVYDTLVFTIREPHLFIWFNRAGVFFRYAPVSWISVHVLQIDRPEGRLGRVPGGAFDPLDLARRRGGWYDRFYYRQTALISAPFFSKIELRL